MLVDGVWRFEGLGPAQASALRESLVFRAYQEVLLGLARLDAEAGQLRDELGAGMEIEDGLGGSATFFSLASAHFALVGLVGTQLVHFSIDPASPPGTRFSYEAGLVKVSTAGSASTAS